MAWRPAASSGVTETAIDLSMKNFDLTASHHAGGAHAAELKSAASFLLWPVVGFVGAVVGGWLELKWLAPLGVGGLFCHYWLDGRIWIRRSIQS